MHVGSSEEWLDLIDSQVPDIISLVIETWESLPPPAANELEDRVSLELCKALRQSRSRCDLPFRIDTQQVELDPSAGQDQGRMDIVFSPMVPREDIYFCLECKRINVRESSGIRPYFVEYVRHGMSRFVQGQYARIVRSGGMLAFVLNGDIDSAIAGVEGNIRTLHSELGMDAPGVLDASSVRPNDIRVRETSHRRLNGADRLLIHHLFMAGDPKTPLRVDPITSRPGSRASHRSTSKKRKGAA